MAERSLPAGLWILLLCLHTATAMSGWAGCLDGQDVFAAIPENSLPGREVADLMAEVTMEEIHWSLEGKDADWFYLDQTSIRLNTSADKVLDREVLGPILMAQLSCYEDDVLQSVYQIVVEIINENDHSPVFDRNTVQSLAISELTPAGTVVFTVLATDGDNDNIIYSIDQTSPDAEFFKVDLPNSGEVVLAKALDYETKTLLTVTIFASEMNTAEHFNTSTNISISVLDGDDQYPQFEPCVVIYQDQSSRICTNPVYTVNITEGEEDVVLDFSPGPIHAVDGDKGLSSPLSYTILSGNDKGLFSMDRKTGEVRLTQRVSDRLTTPVLHLHIMAFQDNDPRKYSVASAVIRVVGVNHFYPEFDREEYHGFITCGKSLASLVNTYGGKTLMLRIQDQDFNQGFNPMMYFTFSPTSNHTDIYQVTQEGLLIGRPHHLKAHQKHVLEVMAVDQESGDVIFTTVVVEVLPEGQTIPHSPLGEERLTGCTVGKAFFLSMVFMTVLGCLVWLVMWLKKKHRGKRDPLERGCVAQGKHPNVSLRWFQLVSHQCAMPNMDEVPYNTEEYGTCNPSFSYHEKQGLYTHQDYSVPLGVVPPSFSNNSSTPTKSPSATPAGLEDDPTHESQHAPSNESNDKPPHTNPNEAPSNQSDLNATLTQSFAAPESQETAHEDHVDSVTSPSSQSSVPCSQTRIASAEIDKPFSKPRVKTPPYSPLLSSPFLKQASTPPPTPEHAPLKATLVQIDTTPPDSPPDSPLETPERTAVTPSEGDQEEVEVEVEGRPSSSQTDPPELSSRAADPHSPTEGRRLSTVSGNTTEEQAVGEEDDGFLGDEDADKNSDGEDELEPDEEELLRVLARCNPVFITFSK